MLATIAVSSARAAPKSQTERLRSVSCSGVLAHSAVQKLETEALAQTTKEANELWGAESVFNSFQRNLYSLLPTPPPLDPRRNQRAEYELVADIDRAVHDMTFDQFKNCFPHAWQFAYSTQQVLNERILQKQKATQQAALEAAKPINRLRLAYFNYMVVKKCYDVRLGYQLVYINEVELERARRAVNAIETSIFGEDSSINTNDVWQEAVRAIASSNQYIEQYFCQKTYNDLLKTAPYSPPVKDFGIPQH